LKSTHVAVSTIPASIAADYQREADLRVSQWRDRLSVFGLQLLIGSCDQLRQSIDQIAELWPRRYSLSG